MNLMERYFDVDLLVSQDGIDRIQQCMPLPTEYKHKWRLWTNMSVGASFAFPAMTQLCEWALDASADMTPNWDIMDEFKQYLVDFV